MTQGLSVSRRLLWVMRWERGRWDITSSSVDFPPMCPCLWSSLGVVFFPRGRLISLTPWRLLAVLVTSWRLLAVLVTPGELLAVLVTPWGLLAVQVTPWRLLAVQVTP